MFSKSNRTIAAIFMSVFVTVAHASHAHAEWKEHAKVNDPELFQISQADALRCSFRLRLDEKDPYQNYKHVHTKFYPATLKIDHEYNRGISLKAKLDRADILDLARYFHVYPMTELELDQYYRSVKGSDPRIEIGNTERASNFERRLIFTANEVQHSGSSIEVERGLIRLDDMSLEKECEVPQARVVRRVKRR